MRESILLRKILLRGSELGARLFRNNVGKAWAGHARHLEGGNVLIQNARPLHAGLCKGSSDIIGFTPVIITQDMVGKSIAVFTAIEVKENGLRATEEQKNFIKVVNDHGGIGVIARTEADLNSAIERFKHGIHGKENRL